MSKSTYITNGWVNSKLVDDVWEIEAPYPPISRDDVSIFREFLTLNGDGITKSMRVDGSTTNRDFYIQSVDGFDIYLTTLSFYIGAELVVVDLSEFGNLPALTNGCQLIYRNSEVGDIIIESSIKSNFELLKICNFKPSFGAGTSVFEINNATGANSEGYMPVLYFTDFGFVEDGLLLRSGKTDRLIFRIRDNLNVGLSSISQFDVVAQGFKRKMI